MVRICRGRSTEEVQAKLGVRRYVEAEAAGQVYRQEYVQGIGMLWEASKKCDPEERSRRGRIRESKESRPSAQDILPGRDITRALDNLKGRPDSRRSTLDKGGA